MAAVLTFAAWSNTGKTTFLEKLIPELKRVRLKLAVIKHDAHALQLDVEGKDSWRLMNAGADAVAVVSNGQTVVMDRREHELETLIRQFLDVDLILTEGYKGSRYPKIALFRSGSGKPLAVPPEECLAIVSDMPMEVSCPVFPLDNAEPLASFLLEWMKRKNER